VLCGVKINNQFLFIATSEVVLRVFSQEQNDVDNLDTIKITSFLWTEMAISATHIHIRQKLQTHRSLNEALHLS
jgi:hypothetical protein